HDEQFRISTIELDDPERPYAVDTVSRLQSQLGESHRLLFLIGADSWAELSTWHEWERLLKMCDLIVVTRPGYEVHDYDRQTEIARVVDLRGKDTGEIRQELSKEIGPRVFLSDGASVDISATTVRAAARVKDEPFLQRQLPPAVAAYIIRHGLYRS